MQVAALKPACVLHHICSLPDAGGHLDGHARIRAKHHLQAPDVALGAVRHKDLARLAAQRRVEAVAQRLAQLAAPLLRAVPGGGGQTLVGVGLACLVFG